MKTPSLILTLLFLLIGTGQAQEKTGTDSPSLQTRQIGDIKVTWIEDRASRQGAKTFPDAGQQLLDSLGLQEGIPSSMSTFLVETDGIKILFDTGMGSSDSKLLPTLASMGIKPADIQYIYLTHFHGDHIGGMMEGDKPVFPNAAVYAARTEYDGWMQMPAERNTQVRKTMETYKERLHLFQFGDKLPGKVQTLDARGHTPGHSVFQIGKLLIVGDIMHGVALQLKRPEICPVYDMDKAAAIASRKRILQYAKENRLLMAGMHFPTPGFLELAK